MNPSIILIACWLVAMLLSRRSIWQVGIISLPGVALHELSHLTVGTLMLAKAVSVSLVPKRQGDRWQLGSVNFTGINIFNAAPVAYAPLLLVGLAWALLNRWVVPVFNSGNYPLWVLSGYVVACALFSCLPSRQDIRMGGLSTFAWGAVCYGLWWLCN